MVLRSGKRRSSGNEKDLTPSRSRDNKVSRSKDVDQATEEKKRTPKRGKKEQEADHIPLPKPMDDHEDEEAPDDVGFADTKKSFLDEVRKQKERSLEEKTKRKEEMRKRQERQMEEAQKKKKKAEDALPQDFLEQLSKDEEEKKKKQQSLNKRKTFDDDDEEEEEGDGDAAPSAFGSNVEVVSRKDERRLNNVAESVLNFKQRMLFGGDREHMRESVDVAIARREKMAQSGRNVFA